MIKKEIRKKIIIRFIAISVISLLLILVFIPQNKVLAAVEVYEPISVSGFTGDVIAENLTKKGSFFVSYNAENYTNTVVDTSNNVLYTNYVAKQYSKKQSGVPDNGVVNSIITPQVQYKLQPYTSNNALLLTAQTPKDTLKLTTSDKYEKLYFLTMSTGGTTYCDLTFTFNDGSTSIYYGYEYGFVIRDWIGNFTSVLGSLGKIDRSTASETGNTGYPKMDEYVIELKKEDQKKIITSIEFNSFMSSTQLIRGIIFAVSGKIAAQNPIPDKPILTNVTNILQESATLNWNTVSNATEYQVDVATDSSFTPSSILLNYNNAAVKDNYLNLTGLKPDTTYYYRVRAKNDSGISESSNVGTFKTLSYEIVILRHPDSIDVEENNINSSLYVEVFTNSKKELIYTWYLCSNESATDIISKQTTGASYVIPSNLKQGNYYIYCEIYNADIAPIKTKVANISVQIIYSLDISWGELMFEFGLDKVWDPETHSYLGKNTYSWKQYCIDGENNKITISNHSSRSLRVTIEYLQKSGVFNKVFNKDTSVQGRFYKSNEEAIKASEYLDGLSKKLTFGTERVEEVIATNKWTGAQNLRSEIYFAFSGMPDLISNQDDQNNYQTVGTIQIKFETN